MFLIGCREEEKQEQPFWFSTSTFTAVE